MIRRTLISAILAAALLLPAAAAAGDYVFSAGAALTGGYNPIWGGYAGADLRGSMEAGDFLEVNADFEALTSGAVTLGASARPKLKFDAGTLYLDAGILCRFTGGGIYDFVSRGAIGWKMKHLEARAGLFSRTLGSFDIDLHSDEEPICEPFNVLYRVQLNLKGEDCDWDLWGGASNFTTFEYERFWSPIFYIGGRKKLSDSVTLYSQAELKPTGMFHLNVCFYGILCRMGVKYSF